MPAENFNAPFFQVPYHLGIRFVTPGHLKSQLVKNHGDTAHSGPADSHEMNIFIF
jgi:hypothetical protein